MSAGRTLLSSFSYLGVSLGLVALLALGGCGSPTPAPAYPSPEDPALADSEFAEVLGLDEEETLPEADDDWEDPGPGDETIEE